MTYAQAFAVCALASLYPLWSVPYPPMVDLPQHAVQVSAWLHYDDPAFGFRELFEFNWFTPYLLGYTIARGFAAFMSVAAALKVTLSLAILGLPLSFHALLAAARRDRWWALLGFPLAYGFSFHWGFLNFIVAAPLVILYAALGIRYAEDRKGGQAAGLACGGILLFFAHALALALGLLAVTALVAARPGSVRARLAALWPLALAALVSGAWVLWVRSVSPMVNSPVAWHWSFARVLELPAMLLGTAYEWEALACGGAILALVALHLERPVFVRERLERAGPLAAALACFAACPALLLGATLLYPRFAVFVPPFAALLVRPGAPPAAVKALLVCLALGWSAVQAQRFHAFETAARPFEEIRARMEPGRPVRYLAPLADMPEIPGAPVFLHYPAWVQAERGGRYDFTAASLFTVLLRHKEARDERLDQPVRAPKDFIWAFHGRPDYFIVRAPVDLGAQFFRDADVPVRLAERSGFWWLYEKLPPAPRQEGGVVP